MSTGKGPRYCPEMQLPTCAYVPGSGASAKPSLEAESFAAWDGQEATLSRAPLFLWGVDLYNHGFYWEAHEAWEELWKQCARGTAERNFLQGLIQSAAAVLKCSHAQREAGARLAERARLRLERLETRYQGLDLGAFADKLAAFVAGRHPQPPQLWIRIAGGSG